jgi:Protein of unknown function (DUF2950)
MRNTNLKSTTFPGRRLSWIAALAFTLLAIGHARLSVGQTSQPNSQPKAFSSPGEASNALYQAVEKDDEQAVGAILGAGKEVTSSNDEVEDKLEREQFSKKYEEMHRLVREPDGRTVLYIGAENWPFPIPLVSKNGKWYFDSDTGKQEILFRRIGENEATAIQVCEEFAMAKNEDDVKAASEDPITRFAEKLVSAGAANTDNKDGNLFHGYYFRIVRPNSEAGASDSRGMGGLTLVAYPAEYRGSGVMTFVVTQHGVVYEKNLGPKTATVAPRIKGRAGSSWHPAA